MILMGMTGQTNCLEWCQYKSATISFKIQILIAIWYIEHQRQQTKFCLTDGVVIIIIALYYMYLHIGVQRAACHKISIRVEIKTSNICFVAS